jgi:hypothetical protein
MNDDLARRVAALVLVALAAIGAALWGALASLEAFRRAGQVLRGSAALVCLPCTGRPGKCSCPSKADCPNPACGAADTIIMHAISGR